MNDEVLEKLIALRLENTFSPNVLRVINESHLHAGHAGHQSGGRHFFVEIYAEALLQCSRVEAHRKIYALFPDCMPMPLHALRIKILQVSGL